MLACLYLGLGLGLGFTMYVGTGVDNDNSQVGWFQDQLAQWTWLVCIVTVVVIGLDPHRNEQERPISAALLGMFWPVVLCWLTIVFGIVAIHERKNMFRGGTSLRAGIA